MQKEEHNFLQNCLLEIIESKAKEVNKNKKSKSKTTDQKQAHLDGYREAADFIGYLCETYLID